MIAVILAGGSGTRFWPRSRSEVPKQLLPIAGDRTLIQKTVERLLPLIPVDRIFIVTNQSHAVETNRQLAGYGFMPANILVEPVGRNTGPAIGFAAAVLSSREDEVMAVLPADHFISDPDRFLKDLEFAESVAGKGYLVTFGIPPTHPETGYGYIRQGPALEAVSGAFAVDRFVEKPDRPNAEKMIAEGGYYWNGGMFVWKTSVFLEEMRSHLPEVHSRLDDLKKHCVINDTGLATRQLDAGGKAVFESLPGISVDYGILEKSSRMALVPASFHWSDVGSWSALDDVLEKDREGNILSPNVVALGCSNSVIQGETRVIGAAGLKDMIVVDTRDALLVCSKEQAQEVKKIVGVLEKENREEVTTPATVMKPWGSYTLLEKRENYLVKRLEVLPGKQLSLQSHDYRCEFWTVVSGVADVELDGESFKLDAGEFKFIPVKGKHRLGNSAEALLVLIEVQFGEKVIEQDITRYQDDFGRC